MHAHRSFLAHSPAPSVSIDRGVRARGFVLAATVLFTRAALAQQPLPFGGVVEVGDAPFSPRAESIVYGACTNAPGPSLGVGSAWIGEDVSFEPGPWGAPGATPRLISAMEFAFEVSGWTGTPACASGSAPGASIRHVIEFYNDADFAQSPMTASAPFATRVVQGSFCSGFAWIAHATFASPVDVGTRTHVFVSIRATDPQTGLRLPDGACGSQPAGQTGTIYRALAESTSALCAGSTTTSFALETGCDTTLHGGPAGTSDHATSAAPALLRCYTQQGNVPPVTPICPLPEGLATHAVSLSPAQSVQWFSICIPADVSDDAHRALSIDTEGATTPLALAWFASDGTLIAQDHTSASTTDAVSHSQLTFGIGVSAPFGAGADIGAPYDGRDGNLPAGTYYLAVAPLGAAFAQAFQVLNVPNVPTPMNTTIRTRASINSALPPLVAPTPDHADFASSLPPVTFADAEAVYATAPATNPVPGPRGSQDASDLVLWTRLDVGPPGATAASGTYVRFEADVPPGTDTVLLVFDSAGNLIAGNDDVSASDLRSRIALGAPHQASPGPAPDLAEGEYFVAIAHWPVDVAGTLPGQVPLSGANLRFHVRGMSQNTAPLALRIVSGHEPVCDSIDFNGDGLFPDTQDLDDFLSVFSGGPCSTGTCADVDYNNDGLFPDTGDIDALLRTFSGGLCAE